MTGRPSVPIAPFAAALVPAVWIFAFQLTTRYPIVTDIVGALGLALFVYGFSVPLAWACGHLAISSMHRFGLIRWWLAGGAGALCGILMFVALGNGQPITAEAALAYGGIGAATGFIYWLVWRYVDTGAQAS